MDLAWELKRLRGMKVMVIPIIVSMLRTNTGVTGNQRKNWDHTDYSFVKIDLNTAVSPEDLKRLAVTQTLVKDHHYVCMYEKCNDSVIHWISLMILIMMHENISQ